ncbi:GH25 family lysozyme [Clostridium neuense]|uniref:GH25 family lysozyme n=1 Tax=Clostridium neuense TaxID=1728934 RepID=A0ABW8TGL0_9CLOT
MLTAVVLSTAFFIPANRAQATTYRGIDIYSGNDISDYSTIKSQGIDIVVAKATQGIDYTDSSFNYRCNHVRDAGLKFGAYHFAGGLYGHTPEAEAQHFLDTIKGQTFDICLWLDLEDYSLKTWGKQEAIDFANRFISYVQTRGYKIGIYCCQSFYYENLAGNILNVPVWLANYSKQPTQFSNIVSWQYSETGRLNSASGNLDMDYFNDSVFTGQAPQQVNNNTSNAVTQSSTDASISTLQSELNRQGFGNLKVDNIPGKRTLAACPTLHYGSQGNITKWVQQQLGINADGTFGKQTRQAIFNFQRSHGLYADGIVGHNTWKALLGL